MKSRLKDTGIIVSITLICIVVIMTSFGLWTRFGINKYLERVIIFIAGFIGVVFARVIIKLLYEFIRWLMKTSVKIFFEIIDWTIRKINNKSTPNKS